MQQILNLMELSFSIGDYAIFSRLIRYFNDELNDEMLIKSFDILTQLTMKQDISHSMLYQCAVCIKKLLSEHDEAAFHL